MEDVWKVRMNIYTALWSFVNFCCFSQSEVSTDNRKVSNFFAFRCCYRSYLDRFLILFKFVYRLICIVWLYRKKKNIIIIIIIIIIITIIIIIIIIDQQENRYNSETASKWLQKLKSLTDTTKACMARSILGFFHFLIFCLPSLFISLLKHICLRLEPLLKLTLCHLRSREQPRL